MNHKTKILALAAAVSLFGVQSAAHAATASASAAANILSPITVTKTSDLDFGKIVAGASASTVTLTSAGALTCGSGLTCSGTHNAAAFNVAGSTGEIVTVASDASVTLISGANSMTASLAPSAASLTLAGGAASFNVGGVLSVGASQAAGAYTGTFNVTVNYQ
tara:strand:- start:3067 stop:3555 length:489 start_codon:yes stop_codon:yes gene_type:complete